MSATGGILPTYQRFVNGVPVPSFSRRSFRPREKYLIFLVFLTFGLVCFGTFFFLPEFRGSNSTVDSVYKVYQHMQKAGPELLIPAPPHLSDSGESLKLIRHDDEKLDPHVVDDRAKLFAKIEQDSELKVLERPNMDLNLKHKPSSTSTVSRAAEDGVEASERDQGGLVPQAAPVVTVPPAHSDHYPDTNRGEDRDPVARERRAKVKEFIFKYFFYRLKVPVLQKLFDTTYNDFWPTDSIPAEADKFNYMYNAIYTIMDIYRKSYILMNFIYCIEPLVYRRGIIRIPIWLPNYEEIIKYSPYYELIYVYEIVIIISADFVMLNFELMCLYFLGTCYVQIEMIKTKLQQIGNSDFTFDTFRECVKHHNLILDDLTVGFCICAIVNLINFYLYCLIGQYLYDQVMKVLLSTLQFLWSTNDRGIND